MFIRAIVKLFGGAWGIRRKWKDAKVNFIKLIYETVYMYSLKLNGSWISLHARIKGEPCFPHGIYGVFISGGAVIGENCVIFQHVTIGSNTLIDSKGFGAPVIGDNCYIGAGAKIIGNIRIGNFVRIGANVVVHSDVPDNCTVISGAQKVILKEYAPNNKFYQKHKGQWRFWEKGSWSNVIDSEELISVERFFEN
jgi:serine O-acetyltransferase